jgi:hypothetical protein
MSNETTNTQTPRTDSCPHCGDDDTHLIMSPVCIERAARQKAEAEVERLKKAITNCLDWANNHEYEWGERAVNAFAFLHAAINPPTNWEETK